MRLILRILESMACVYGVYKPLRNYLRNADLVQGLGAIRWYLNYLQLRDAPKIPTDMEVDPRFLREGIGFIQPWDLTVIARELIIHANTNGSKNDFRKPRHLYGAITKIKDIEDYIAQNYLGPENIHHYVSKVLPMQQFGWQSNRPNYLAMNRYYMLYSTDELKELFKEEFGLSLEKYYLMCLLLWNNFNTNFGLDYPPRLDFKNSDITKDDYDKTLQHFTLTLAELKQRLIENEQEITENFLIYYDYLKKFPLVFMNYDGRDRHVCPVPTHLYWRFTEGIYYDFMDRYTNDDVKREAFGKMLGDSLSFYVGEILRSQRYSKKSVFDIDSIITGSLPKADWVITEKEDAIFFECKTKRMALAAQQEFALSDSTKIEFTKLAQAVVQCYLAIQDAKSRDYKFVRGVRNFHPVLVTMENWYIAGDTHNFLRKLVIEEGKKKGIGYDFIEEHPYIVMSLSDFETTAYLLTKRPLKEVFGKIKDMKYEAWNIDTILKDAFKSDVSNIILFKDYPLDRALSELTGQTIGRGKKID